MLKKDGTYKVTIEQRPKGCEGTSNVVIWRTHVLGRRNNNAGWPNLAKRAKGKVADKRSGLGRVRSKSHRAIKVVLRTLDFTMNDG